MAMRGLGIPYMGSKRKLAVDIIDFIARRQPEATTLKGGSSLESSKRLEWLYYNEK